MNITADDVGRQVIAKSGNIGTIIRFSYVYETDDLPVLVEFNNPMVYFHYPVTGEATKASCIRSDYSIEFYKAEEH